MLDSNSKTLLAVDSSSADLILALSFGEDRLVQSRENVERSHGEQIIKQIDVLVRSSGIEKEQLDGIVVNIGPGSFTGLRIGIAAAKGMAVALEIPILSVSLFELAMSKLPEDNEAADLIVPFIRDQYFAADLAHGLPQPEEVSTWTIEQLQDSDKRRKIYAIGFDKKSLTDLKSKVASIQPIDYNGADLIRFGGAKLAAGRISDINALEPLYIQKSQAELKYEKRKAEGRH